MEVGGDKRLIKAVLLIACILTTIQALAWMGLCTASILYYQQTMTVEPGDLSDYEKILFDHFLDPNQTNERDELCVPPSSFNIFMILYIPFCLVWFTLSSYLLWAVCRQKWKKYIPKIMLGWSCTTFIIAVVDLTLMIMLIKDYATIKDAMSAEVLTTTSADSLLEDSFTSATTTDNIDETARNLPIVVRSLFALDQNDNKDVLVVYLLIISGAVRGYVLWIFNVLFALTVAVLAQKMIKSARPSLLSPIDAYSTGSRPFSLYDQTEIELGIHNDAFDPAFDGFGSPKPRNPLGSSRMNPYADPAFVGGSLRIARVGKIGPRTPPRAVSPPNVPSQTQTPQDYRAPEIPEPDYSPPNTPGSGPKSVLKPRSNYQL